MIVLKCLQLCRCGAALPAGHACIDSVSVHTAVCGDDQNGDGDAQLAVFLNAPWRDKSCS